MNLMPWDLLQKLVRRPRAEPLHCAFPPPYRRMIAINSDVEFTSWRLQKDLFGCLAERDLETAFSFWFFGDPAATWHIFNRNHSLTDEGAAAVGLLRSGLLDTIHSFTGVHNGHGYDFDREMIRRGYARLAELGVRSRVFSNHGTVDDIQNVGGEWVSQEGYPNYMKGDVPGSQRYHLDLSVRHGVRFFWLDIDRVREHVSFTATQGEAHDHLFVAQVSRDGTPILRFRRTDAMVPPDGAMLGEALNRVLSASNGGYSIIYTHLGVKRDANERPLGAEFSEIPSSVFAGLDRLAEEQRAGRVLVTTTSRLLCHALMSAARPWTITRRGRHIDVHFQQQFTYAGVPFEYGWADFMGFCLPVGRSDTVRLHLGPESRVAEVWNTEGQLYAGIPWRRIDMKAEIRRAHSLARV
jgi:hypothetical protein